MNNWTRTKPLTFHPAVSSLQIFFGLLVAVGHTPSMSSPLGCIRRTRSCSVLFCPVVHRRQTPASPAMPLPSTKSEAGTPCRFPETRRRQAPHAPTAPNQATQSPNKRQARRASPARACRRRCPAVLPGLRVRTRLGHGHPVAGCFVALLLRTFLRCLMRARARGAAAAFAGQSSWSRAVGMRCM
jgi:hypothetical protein